MNQTPAAILILTSSILAYAATQGTTAITNSAGVTTHSSPIGVILGLAGLVLGIWGVISLIGASIRDRELAFDGQTRNDLLGMFDPRRMARPYAPPMGNPVGAARTATAGVDPSGVALTPEMKAQLSMAAHLEGRERSQIVEEALRRYLPRYENYTKAA
jgi:hypothetical protein